MTLTTVTNCRALRALADANQIYSNQMGINLKMGPLEVIREPK
jgi:hypothetical protein